MPLNGDANFSIGTINAFTDLPWETASTYGGTSFQRTSAHTAIVKDQLYHYKLRPNNSLGNIGRNIINELGKPEGGYFGQGYNNHYKPPTGQSFTIHYTNPTIRFK